MVVASPADLFGNSVELTRLLIDVSQLSLSLSGCPVPLNGVVISIPDS